MEYEISLAKFLSRVTNLTGKDLSKLRHEDVKILFPYLKRTSFDYVFDNPGLVCLGEVIMVNDGRKIIPYINPEICLDEEKVELHVNKIPKHKINDNHYDYNKLSTYELRCLLIKKLNSYRNQMAARRELEKRGELNHKKYKRSEEKELLLRRMKNEGY